MTRPDTPRPLTPTVSAPGPGRLRVLRWALALATAALLAVDAYVHLHDAGLYGGTTSALSESTVFRTEAVVALVVAIALLLRPHPLVWAVAVLVAASALGAVLLYTYVDVGALGPLPDMYEPTWAPPGKRLSAVAEGVAALLALAGLALALRRPRRPEPVGADLP